MVQIFAFSALLIATATLLTYYNLRQWREHQNESLPEKTREFHYRQFRRRVQVNIMIGVVGVAIGFGQLLTDPLVVGLFWCGVLLLVAWIVLLALADMLMTKVHFDSLQREQNSELRSEVKRHKESREVDFMPEQDDHEQDDL